MTNLALMQVVDTIRRLIRVYLPYFNRPPCDSVTRLYLREFSEGSTVHRSLSSPSAITSRDIVACLLVNKQYRGFFRSGIQSNGQCEFYRTSDRTGAEDANAYSALRTCQTFWNPQVTVQSVAVSLYTCRVQSNSNCKKTSFGYFYY